MAGSISVSANKFSPQCDTHRGIIEQTVPRRAFVRHLPSWNMTHHHAVRGQRHHPCIARCCAASVSGGAGPGQGHFSVYQQPRQLCHRRHGDLRHHELYQVRRFDHICIGMAASMGAFLLLRREAKRYACERDHDPSAVRRHAGSDPPIWRFTSSVSEIIKERMTRILAGEHRKPFRDRSRRLRAR